MKIAIDARIINSSTGRYVERLLTYLEKTDKTNTYIVLVPTKEKGYWKPSAKNFEVKTVDFKNYSFGEQIGYCKFLYSLKADLVHFCMPQQPLLYFKKHVTTVHDLTLLRSYSSDKNWFVYHLKQLVGRFVFFIIGHTSQLIITDADYTAQEYAHYSHINQDKIHPIHLAADVLSENPIKPQQEFNANNFILYVGAQNDYKNIRSLIQAHQTLRVDRPDLELVLVGSLNDTAKHNKRWAEEKGLQGIRFTGFVSDDELAWLYKNCRAYVFPSLMEGFGLPGLEAMIHGAPVASSNATCLPEIYGDAALYFDPTSVSDMASTVASIIDDESVRNELVKRGYEQAAKYSWQRMAEQTHDVYMKTLDS